MNDYSVAEPQCVVDIFPFEGGRYSITGADIVQCVTRKNIKEDEGTFQLRLAPMGPHGANGGPPWTSIITPKSLAVIGMTRGRGKQIVMIGVVDTCSEDQTWSQGPVTRGIVVQGRDFASYFSSFNWCALTFLGTPAAAVGQQLGSAAAGLAAILGGNLLQGPPDKVARDWYNKIMAGTEGVLSRTTLQYRGRGVLFSDLVAQWFQAYPGYEIPFGDYYIATEGTWISKFRSILAFPWYEFFVTTAPPDLYSTLDGGTPLGVTFLDPSITARPAVVGRINPLPRIPITVNGQTVSVGAVDVGAWRKLPLYVPEFNFVSSNVAFTATEVRNFYLLNPTWFRRMFGDNNAATISFLFSFVGAADPASIHRYGYHPEYSETRWLADMNGAAAQTGGVDVFNLIADMTARVISYYHPTPLMARGSASFKLSPTINPGCRFRYNPFKGQPTWDFYIEGVTHRFDFGGQCETTLDLARGLPSSVYGDVEQTGILTQLHVGNAQRLEGVYAVGLPPGSAPPLTFFGVGDGQIDNVLGNIAQVYLTPQAK